MENEGRCAVHVGGTAFPGFNSLSEAEKAIIENPEWKNEGAVATPLYGSVKKGTFISDFPPARPVGHSKPER